MNPDTSHIETSLATITPENLRASSAATAQERADLFPDHIISTNVDVPFTVANVVGALPRLKTFREDIVRDLPSIDIDQFDRLQTYAEALLDANAAFTAASSPGADVVAFMERGTAIRDSLVADTTTLTRHKLVDPAILGELKGGTGYLNVAADLLALVKVLNARWSAIASKTAIEKSLVDEAERISLQITFAFAKRSQQSAEVSAAADERDRAFTLLVNAYSNARKSIGFLRYEAGDADKILPSLWARGGGRTKKSSTDEAPAAPTPTDTTTAPVAPVAPVVPAAHPVGLPPYLNG